jgi:hypothetical protein
MGTELERLRDDLNVIQQTLGTDHPLTWKDVGSHLLLTLAGACMAVTAWLVPIGFVRLSALPVAAVAIPSLLALREKSSSDARQFAHRREDRLAWRVTIVLLVVIVPYLLWERRLAISAQMTAAGAAVMFTGVVCAAIAITSPHRRFYWGFAIPLVAWGLLLPGESLRQIAVSGGIACAFAGLFAAGIVARQLRRWERA